jgi:hypothetical protein
MSDLDEGYMRADTTESVTISDLSERPEDAQGEGKLIFAKRVTADDLAEAFDAYNLLEQLEEYAYENGLLGEGPLCDCYDYEGDLGEKMAEALRTVLKKEIVKSRYFHIEEIKE